MIRTIRRRESTGTCRSRRESRKVHVVYVTLQCLDVIELVLRQLYTLVPGQWLEENTFGIQRFHVRHSIRPVPEFTLRTKVNQALAGSLAGVAILYSGGVPRFVDAVDAEGGC